MADWVGRMAFLLQPLAEAIGAHVRAGETLHADDTPVPVLDPGRGKTKTGRLWVAVRDERPWGSAVPPAVFYQICPGPQGRAAPRRCCRDAAVIFMPMLMQGSSTLYEPHPITGIAPLTEVACWAHARRKIFEVHAATASPRAQELLEHIGRLFAIEAAIKGRSAGGAARRPPASNRRRCLWP